MIPLPPSWTLLTVFLWTSGSGQILNPEPVKILYAKIHSTASIECDCVDSCQSAQWFRTIPKSDKVEYLGWVTSANRFDHGDNVDKERFKFNKGTSNSFVLRIIDAAEKDTGIYSCILRNRKKEDICHPGTLLLPGVTPPTLPPKTVNTDPPLKPFCPCMSYFKLDGCIDQILGPLVGLMAGLTLAIICTLLYFSRLPKKCRHHIVKGR